jgi:hypothetical protein
MGGASCLASNPVDPVSSDGQGGRDCVTTFTTSDIFGDGGPYRGCCQNIGGVERFFACCTATGTGDSARYECPK